MVPRAGATLTVEASVTVSADRSRLQQLLENLLANAAEHGGDEPAVTVGDLADGFYVADDGPGVPEAQRQAIFQAGYSTSDTGTGFGLRIVEQVADAHGWTIRVTDSDSGGTRVEVTGVDIVG